MSVVLYRIGIVCDAVCTSPFQEFFDFLLPLLQASVQLLEVYSDTAEVVEVILEMFALTAENFIVFLSQVRGRGLHLELIQRGCIHRLKI